MDNSHLRNQEELVRDFVNRNSFTEEETLDEEIRIPAVKTLHLSDRGTMRDIFLLVAKCRPVITEIKWSLVDSEGNLALDTKKATRFVDKTLVDIHIQPEARLRIANLLTGFMEQEDVLALHFRTGEKYLEVVKGSREGWDTGKMLVSSTNPFAY